MDAHSSQCDSVEDKMSGIPLEEAILEWERVEECAKSGSEVPVSLARRALQAAMYHIRHDKAREFVAETMYYIVHNILSQNFSKQQTEQDNLLELSTAIIAKFMEVHSSYDTAGVISVLHVLSDLLLVQETKYYEDTEGNTIRFRLIDAFHEHDGFSNLVDYLSSSGQDIHISPFMFDLLGSFVDALSDLAEASPSKNFNTSLADRRQVAVDVARAIFGVVKAVSLSHLEGEPLSTFGHVLEFIGRLLDLAPPEDNETNEFDTFYRDTVLQLINSEGGELKDMGWRHVSKLVYRAISHRPPARTILVRKAGCNYVNGTYKFSWESGEFGSICSYEKDAPRGLKGAKKLVIYPIQNVGNNLSLWVLGSRNADGAIVENIYSETKDDSIFFLYRPPGEGWNTMRNKDSYGPPPVLRYIGFMDAPSGMSLEHQLAEWSIENKVIEVFYQELGLQTPLLHMLCVSDLMRLLCMLPDENGNAEILYRSELHSLVLHIWDFYIGNHDVAVAIFGVTPLVVLFHDLPDEIATGLVKVMRDCVVSDYEKVEVFFKLLAGGNDTDTEPFPVLRAKLLSDEVRPGVQRLMWYIRTNDRSTVQKGSECYSYWMTLETFGDDSSESVSQKLLVSLVDPESRKIQVSMPVESESGEFYAGIRVSASRDDGRLPVTIATAGTELVNRCLQSDHGDRVVIDTTLPEEGRWIVECTGFLHGEDKSSKSMKSTIELANKNVELEKLKREEICAADELARQHAGEIHGTIGKLRNHSSSQMDATARFSLLHTAVVRGRSTLNELKRLVEANESVEASAPGIVMLTDALTEAHLPMSELEATLKLRNRKDRAKGFKNHVVSLLEKGGITSWLESVGANDLECLGGDANRLYQLLAEDKGSKLELGPSILHTASIRDDLFSKKQIKTLKKLCAEADSVAKNLKEAVPVHKKEAVPGHKNATDKSTCEQKGVPVPQATQQDGQVVEELPRLATNQDDAKIAVPLSTASDDFALLTFLQEHAAYLKGFPESFCQWLVDSEDILSLEDLATAVSDHDYLVGVLQKGDGTDGVKGFRRDVFKKAVLAATAAPATTTIVGTDGDVFSSIDKDEDKENISPATTLLCPISHVLMTNKPVLAADGHTYELAAIAEYFDQENAKIEAAKRKIKAGNKSKKLRAIVDRGIVSPVTNEKMENLALTSNKTVRSMAREAASTAAKADQRVPLARR